MAVDASRHSPRDSAESIRERTYGDQMMRKTDKRIISALVAAAVTVGLGAGRPAPANAATSAAIAPAPGAAAAPAPDKQPTRGQMRKALLAQGDLPRGFTLTQRGDDAMGDVFRPNARCDLRPGEPDYEPLPPSVYAMFGKGDAGPNLIEAIGATGTRLSARMIESLTQVVDHCPVSTYPGGTTTITRLRFPRFGDKSIAVLATAKDRDGTHVSTEQSMIGIVAYHGVCAEFQLSNSDELSIQNIETIVRRGADKLQRIG